MLHDPVATGCGGFPEAPIGALLPGWKPEDAPLWGNTPHCIEHALHRHDLFTDEALEQLIETYPRERYNLIQWNEEGGERTWLEGEFGGLSGRDVLKAVAAGRIWIQLKNVGAVDPRYAALADTLFEEVESQVPGLKTFKRIVGILISSPGSRTHYHADIHTGSCWHIRGRKRFYVYPATPPFVKKHDMEDVFLHGVEVDLPYEPWFDRHAQVFDLEPGQMLHWPHHAPHRVENLGSLNISLLVEYRTRETFRHVVAMRANAILRRKFGIEAASVETSGLSFWGKFALQALMRRTRTVKKELRSKRPTVFRLDPDRLGELVAV